MSDSTIKLDAPLGIYGRLALAAGRVGPIAKGERNRQQGFDFRSIEQITGKVRATFADLGVAIVPHRIVSLDTEPVTSSKGASGYRTTVIVEYLAGCDVFIDGDLRREEIVLSMAGEAIDYGDKSTSKAVQMAYKYALTEALSIGSEQDPDGDTVEVSHDYRESPVVTDPIVELKKALAEKVGVPDAKRAWTAVYPTETNYPTLPDKETFETALKILVDTALTMPTVEGGEDE